jgi:hypothetical protein
LGHLPNIKSPAASTAGLSHFRIYRTEIDPLDSTIFLSPPGNPPNGYFDGKITNIYGMKSTLDFVLI